MSVNHWKLLNQIRDSLSKLSNDKPLQNVFGKDFTQLLQKLPSSLYNIEVVKYFERDKPNVTKTSQDLPTVLPDVKDPVIESKERPKKVLRWKNLDHIATKSSITSQTQHVILSIATAESDESLIGRIETLIKHIKQFPEARNGAIRGGAIQLLLRARLRTADRNLQDPIREALALMGYANPVPGKGVRILAMDGGGIRGLLVLEMLKKLEELTGQRIHELFDLFCGVSTGAILSFTLGIHRPSLSEIAEAYKDISLEVFKQSPLWGTSSLIRSQAYYDTALWERRLKERLGTCSLISTSRDPLCPKLCAVSAVVNQTRLSAYVFRNYSLPWRIKSQYFGSSHHEIWEAARASAAAPTYFEECKLGNFLHQDGGILVNNPAAVALHEAKLIWPDTPVQCVVSFGTGRIVPSPSELAPEVSDNANSTSWANKFFKILDSATDTEGVHIMLNDLLPNNMYYRFNPYLTEVVSMVEIDPKKLEQLQRDALMYLRRNEDKFQQVANALTEKKTFVQKTKDFVNLQGDLHGF